MDEEADEDHEGEMDEEGDANPVEEGHTRGTMIRVPLIREIDGRFVSTQERHEEAIKRHLTVTVSRSVALHCQIPFVCHSMADYCKSNAMDKTNNPTPFSALLEEDELTAFYDRASDFEEMVDRDSLSPEKRREYEGLNRLDHELWRNHISETEYRKRVARENRLTQKEEQSVACRVNKVDIQCMTSDEIYRYLSHQIRNHPENLLDIAHMLARTNHPIQKATSRLLKMVFCGSSGIGKTELIRHIAILFGMQEGGEYEKCHIRIDFATCLEKGHANIITGPGPGYIGCEEPCLVDNLIEALEFINTKDAVQQREEEEEEEEGIPNKKARRRTKVIMLEINEMDKGSPSIFTALNRFLDTGSVSSHRGRHFILPSDVFLVMCACSNFASDYFCSLPVTTHRVTHDRIEARKKIIEAMGEKGLQEWDIVRLGTLIPFFPIRRNDAREIMLFKLREFIAQKGLYVDHIKMSMSMSEAAQDLFIDHLMDNMYTETSGIRHIVYCMKDELTNNLTTQCEFLDRHIDSSIPVPFAQRPSLYFQCVEYKEGSTSLSMVNINRDPALRVRDRSQGRNECHIRECLSYKSDIAFFMLDCDTIKKKDTIGVHILSPIPKKKEYTKRKGNFDVRPIEKRPRLEQEEGEENVDIVEDVIVEFGLEEIHQSRGRPRKYIEAFTYYDTRNKRSRHQCDNRNCRKIVDSRRTSKHQCRTK